MNGFFVNDSKHDVNASIVGSLASIPVVTDGTDVFVNSASTNAQITIALPAVAGKLNYVTGFEVSGVGSTAGGTINIHLDGIFGYPTYFVLKIPAGGAVDPLIVQFTRPIPAVALNTAISLVVPAFGLGSTLQSASLHGFYK